MSKAKHSLAKRFPERIRARKLSHQKKSQAELEYRSKSRKKRIGHNVYIDKSPYKVKTNFFEDSVFMHKRRRTKNKSNGLKSKSRAHLTEERRSKQRIVEYLNPRSVKQIQISQTQQSVSRVNNPNHRNKTSLNCIRPGKPLSCDGSDNSDRACLSQKCVESEKNICGVEQRVLRNEFMSVKADAAEPGSAKLLVATRHKKGNKSMNLRNEGASGNQLQEMKLLGDFDLQTLDLGNSEVKT